MTTPATEMGIEPCPFCGSSASISDGNNGLHFRVICTKAACRAAGPLERCATDALAAWNTRAEATRTPEAAQVESLFPAIAHGDDEHHAWLKKAIDAHFAGEPVPPCRGKGRKEAQVEILREALVLGSDNLKIALQAQEECADTDEALSDTNKNLRSTLAALDAALAQVRHPSGERK